MKATVEKIVDWLRQQVKDAKVNGLIVGVSGGLDSAVVAYLIKRALPDNSLGVIMPLKTKDADINDATSVVNSCDLKHITVDLTQPHELLLTNIMNEVRAKDEINLEKEQLVDANQRARLRMTTLYTLAANYNYLVVGTDNASEWYTGYFTKYGDGGVDIQPIISLTKQEVYEMARYLDVPQSVIDKQPSADLWEGQTDEAEMGTSYAKIDSYIKGEPVPEADKMIIEQMHNRTSHKRNIATQFNLK